MKTKQVTLSAMAFIFAIAAAVASTAFVNEETVGGVQNDPDQQCNVSLSPVDTSIGCATNYTGPQCRLSDNATPAYKTNGSFCVTAILRKN
jgi:hypothetical protein